ncbi:MAG: tRNA (adenosine(37)-N6)-threonylcarbamoyltransferase complex dimerization subunit type 1 TsaB [Armatimonadetes bacterium]|nr:tRNA (adenosine(37)-N6)-threonylcarbamoyltransferase complex dimerization subunit type 1 TsaB [Armatimonadota bacterium]
MIAVISTSSPRVSVALISDSGAVVSSGTDPAKRQASEVAIRLLNEQLDQAQLSLKDVAAYAPDVGPGSFTGVRVGVTLCKMLAYAFDRQIVPVTAFDLISPAEPVAIHCKRDEYFLRIPQSQPTITTDKPESCVGYGGDLGEQLLPDAANFARVMESLQEINPALVVPLYIAEPSISTPKRDMGLGGTGV